MVLNWPPRGPQEGKSPRHIPHVHTIDLDRHNAFPRGSNRTTNRGARVVHLVCGPCVATTNLFLYSVRARELMPMRKADPPNGAGFLSQNTR